MNERTRYPLSWPNGWKRTPAAHRRVAKFVKVEKVLREGLVHSNNRRLSLQDSLQRIECELERFGAAGEVIVSTNLPLRIDGSPRGDRSDPSDPGVAIYWTRRGKPRCMAIDLYTRVADNIAAIAATLEAMRAVERHGGGEILDRTFEGFAALPAASKAWREVLNFHPNENPSAAQIDDRFREIAKKRHPDRGGSLEGFQELSQARAAALEEVQGRRAISA